MNSLVLYSKSDNKETTSNDDSKKHETEKVEFHINLWKVKNGIIKVIPNLIFDFGIKFDSTITELCLFLPFRISKHGSFI